MADRTSLQKDPLHLASRGTMSNHITSKESISQMEDLNLNSTTESSSAVNTPVVEKIFSLNIDEEEEDDEEIEDVDMDEKLAVGSEDTRNTPNDNRIIEARPAKVNPSYSVALDPEIQKLTSPVQIVEKLLDNIKVKSIIVFS